MRRRSSRSATRCWRSWSRARKTSCGASSCTHNDSFTHRRYRVVVRRPAAPVALAWAARLAGLISIVSALTPELADRVDLVRGVLPPGVPEAARTVALALGLAMVFLSRGLARRK